MKKQKTNNKLTFSKQKPGTPTPQTEVTNQDNELFLRMRQLNVLLNATDEIRGALNKVTDAISLLVEQDYSKRRKRLEIVR